MMEQLITGARKLELELSSKQLEQFEVFYRELIEWNKQMNLTRITDYEEVQIKHFLDSLTITLALRQPLSEKTRVIDVGTGAGIPGIPLKIVFPDIRLTLLEATTKKTHFLKHIANTLGLGNVEIVAGRAEETAHQSAYRESFDIVLSRAVAPLVTLVELTLPFCAIGGGFISQKKEPLKTELSLSNRAIGLLGGKLWEVRNINFKEFPDERRLVVIDKVSPTPPQYPRRPGIPAKIPLFG